MFKGRKVILRALLNVLFESLKIEVCAYINNSRSVQRGLLHRPITAMDNNARIMKELKELQEAARNVCALNLTL